MKKAFRIIGIVLALSLVVGLAISCDPSTVPDGKTAQTKKSMTSAEYKANSKALEGMAVVEAYAMTQPEGTSGAKGLAKEYKFYSVYYPIGNGIFNIDKSIEDILWIIDNELKKEGVNNVY